MLYKAIVRGTKRQITCEVDITLERAIDFLNETPKGLITDGVSYFTKEELINVKSIRSLPGIRKSDISTSFGTLHENSNRELSSPAGSDSKSSTKRDNKWD